MESNIINIATLTIDKTAANNSIVETKQQIFELQKANSDLRKDISKNGDATGEQTKKFVENEAELKKLTTQYRTQQAAINDVTLAEVKNSKALTDSVKTIDQANAQNKELLKTRNQLDATTKEGAEALTLINAKIDQNKKFVTANSSEQEKAATITGNYRQKIFEMGGALDNTIPGFAQARTIVGGFANGMSAASDTVTKYTASAFESTKATLGFKTSSQLAAETTAVQTTATEAQTVAQGGLTTATNTTTTSFKLLKVAIASTGIGLLIIAVVALQQAFTSSEEGQNKFAKILGVIGVLTGNLLDAFASLGEKLISVFENPQQALNDLGGLIKAQIVNRVMGLLELFPQLAKAIKLAFSGEFTQAATVAFNATSKITTGVDNLTGKLGKAGQAVKDFAAEQAKEAKQAAQVADMRAKADKIDRKLLIDRSKLEGDIAEKRRDAADKENFSATQRQALLKDAQKLEDALLVKETESKTLRLNAIRLENTFSRTNKENLTKEAQAEADLNNVRTKRFEQQRSTVRLLQRVNKEVNGDRAADAKAESDRQLKALNDSETKFKSERRTTEEQLAFYQKYYSDLDKLQNGSERIKNASDFSAKVLEISNKTIADEIAAQSKAIIDKKALSLQERDDLVANADFLKKTESERVATALLTEADKAKALEEIQKGYLANISAINQTFEQSEKLRKEEQAALDALAFETRLLTIQEQGAAESEIRRQLLAAEYEEKQRLIDADLENEKITAKQATAIRLLEEKKYAQATKAIDKEVAKTKRDAQFNIAQQAIAAAQMIFGESKALSIASALINTYQGITAELSTKAVTPYEIGLKVANVAFVAASGFAAVKNILKTDKGSTGGGTSGGATTSTPASVFENPARTATVATVDAAPAIPAATGSQPVLVLATLDEVKNQQQIKIKSD